MIGTLAVLQLIYFEKRINYDDDEGLGLLFADTFSTTCDRSMSSWLWAMSLRAPWI